jgi:hypothetical protein
MKITISRGREIRTIFSLLFCIFMGNMNFMYSQNPDICATPDPTTEDPLGVYSGSIDAATLASYGPVVFNIFFWSINDGNGNPGNHPLTEEKCLASVAHLNIVYNPFNIYFKYYGMDNESFNNENYYHLTKAEAGSMFNFAASNGYKKPDAFNIYIASGGTAFGGIAQNYNKVNVATHPWFYTKDDTMVHEIGHCFNLYHTWQNWTSSYSCEKVTRDINDPNFNADIRGDKVVDTPAMPDFLNEYCHYNGLPNTDCQPNNGLGYYYIDQSDFSYEGPGQDCSDPPEDYEIYPIDVKNYMSYSPTSPSLFFKNLTMGQKIRMWEAIEEDTYGEFDAAKNIDGIASLYEPYRGEYYLSGPFDPAIHTSLFQPGFEYRFIECDCECPQPLAYGDPAFTSNNSNIVKSISKFENDFTKIWHPNHTAISIVPPNPQVLANDFGVWRCYDNNNKSPNGGSVIKFNDNVFNNNVTITPKDSTSINNPTLIDDLQPGLYKIEKNYEDGSQQETVIIKEND